MKERNFFKKNIWMLCQREIKIIEKVEGKY